MDLGKKACTGKGNVVPTPLGQGAAAEACPASEPPKQKSERGAVIYCPLPLLRFYPNNFTQVAK